MWKSSDNDEEGKTRPSRNKHLKVQNENLFCVSERVFCFHKIQCLLVPSFRLKQLSDFGRMRISKVKRVSPTFAEALRY